MGRPFVCAGSESRTRTPLLAYAPETYASTNSAIPAKDVSKAGAKISAFLSDAKFFFKTIKFFSLVRLVGTCLASSDRYRKKVVFCRLAVVFAEGAVDFLSFF